MNGDIYNEEGYRRLAAAIIGQAVQGYETAHHLQRYFEHELKVSAKTLKECEDFFTSGYFAKIAEMDDKRFLRLLKEKISRQKTIEFKTVAKTEKYKKKEFYYTPSMEIADNIQKCKSDIDAMKLYSVPDYGFGIEQYRKIADVLMNTFIVSDVLKSPNIPTAKAEEFKSELEKSLNNCFNILKENK